MYQLQLNFHAAFRIFLLFSCLSFSVYAGSSKLDALFFDLKNAENVSVARELENQIWISWLDSGDNKVNEMMQDALRKRRVYDFNGALEILNKVIKLKPDYAEVWNQRATVYFHQEEYEKSLWDIAKTLELEPRHFGSLAGRAVIRLKQNKPALARQNIVEALKFHPYLKEKAIFPGL
jgi:Tfp pilus assembly protein PilF